MAPRTRAAKRTAPPSPSDTSDDEAPEVVTHTDAAADAERAYQLRQQAAESHEAKRQKRAEARREARLKRKGEEEDASGGEDGVEADEEEGLPAALLEAAAAEQAAEDEERRALAEEAREREAMAARNHIRFDGQTKKAKSKRKKRGNFTLTVLDEGREEVVDDRFVRSMQASESASGFAARLMGGSRRMALSEYQGRRTTGPPKLFHTRTS